LVDGENHWGHGRILNKITQFTSLFPHHLHLLELEEKVCERADRIQPEAGSCEYINEPSNSIKGGEILDRLSDYQLLKDDATS
jgi:hypothetical protein